jgi:hypothetical protein
VALGIELHERFNAYVGMYLGDLYREKTELQQVLWDNFTDAELIAIVSEIIKDISSEADQANGYPRCSPVATPMRFPRSSSM